MSDTREFIIDQAYPLFLARSYEAVSIFAISKAIGLTKGALYHHFTNKEDLFKAVIDKYLIIDALSSTKSEITLAQLIEETIEETNEIIHGILGKQPNYLPINYLSLIIDAFRHYPGFFTEKGNLLDREIGKIKTVMDRAIDNGEIRSEINTSLMAANYFALTMSLAPNILYNSSAEQAIDSLRNQLAELYKLLKI